MSFLPHKKFTWADFGSGAGGFEGSGGVRAISSSSAVWPPPHPTYTRKKSHRIFTFHMDPTGQLRGVRTPGPPWPATPLDFGGV